MNSILKPRFFACALFLLGLSIPVIASADADLTHPIAALVLKDGRRLKNAMFVSYSSTGVMAKWDGGRGTIMFDDLPANIAEKAKLLRSVSSKAITSTAKATSGSPAAPKVAPIQAREITGQVFVTTRGAGAYRFAGTRVYAFALSDFDQIAAEAESNVASEKAKSLTMIKFNRSDADTIRYNTWESAITRLTPVASSRTDGDGVYHLTLRSKEPLFIYCATYRHIGKEREFNVWAVPVNSSDQIDLNSSNQF